VPSNAERIREGRELGYLLSPEQTEAWFHKRDIKLIKDFYTVLGNCYLLEKNFEARIRSYNYNGQHGFLFLTHKAIIDNSIASAWLKSMIELTFSEVSAILSLRSATPIPADLLRTSPLGGT